MLSIFRSYQMAIYEAVCQAHPRTICSLKLCFTNAVIEDPTHRNDSILASLNNKFIEAYLEFMDYNLGRMVSFNVLFQSEMPLLHRLKGKVEKLIKSFCFDFLEVAYVINTNAFEIDPSRSDKQVPLSKVYLGHSIGNEQ